MWSIFQRNEPRSKPNLRTTLSICPHLEALEDRCLLSTSGALDTTFGGTGVVTTSLNKYQDTAYTVLIQPNGKIVDAGQSATNRGSVMALPRYNANGTLDSTFGSGGKDITSVGGGGFAPAALDPGITDASGNEAIAEAGYKGFALFNPNGSADTSFGNKGGVTVPYSIAGVVVQQVGSSYDIVVAGDNGSEFEMTRFTSSGKVDTTFGSNGTATLAPPTGLSGLFAESLHTQSDGKLVISGEGAGGSTVFELARFTANGQLDPNFGGGNGYVTGSFGTNVVSKALMAIYPTTGTDTADYGKIVAVCDINGNPGGGNQVGLARFNADGTADSTFGQSGQVVTPFPGSNVQAWATTLESDGKIVVAGATYGTNLAGGSQRNFSLLRYNTDGSLDTTFSNSYGQQIFPNGGLVATPIGTANSRTYAVAIQPDGRIVAAGAEPAIGSSTSDFMTARYLAGPEIGTFTTSASTLTAGSNLTLNASNLSDGDPGASITQVTFYAVDSNGNTILLGSGTADGSGDWSLDYTVSLASGTYKLYAQAEGSDGIIGDSAFLSLTVQ